MSLIKCGNRKAHPEGCYHASVEGVRLCYQGKQQEVNELQNAYPQGVPEPPERKPIPKVNFHAPLPETVKVPLLSFPMIPVGGMGKAYFALPDDEGLIHFYRVSKPTEGKWAGRTFLDEQSGDEFYGVGGGIRSRQLLTQIAADPEEAGKLYAREIKKCWQCGRNLTTKRSRDAGIGPKCAARL